VLKIDEHFKASQINILEVSREHLFLPEYKQSIRESVLQESTHNSYNVQMQVAQAA